MRKNAAYIRENQELKASVQRFINENKSTEKFIVEKRIISAENVALRIEIDELKRAKVNY